ncbi:M48 family metalloprotease [Streptomyces sp. NPDC093707]|uniref:M48 family metalloprotease n=1 Tax=Streptomyces sp. NPDC093707 TaxID=3154984 RepID=UPI00344E0024
MRIDVYLSLLFAVAPAAVSPVAGRRLAPAYAARTLVIAGTVASAASVWALVLLGATLLDDVPPIAAEAHSRGASVPGPVPVAIALPAVAVLVAAVWRVQRVLRTHARTRRALRRLSAAHPTDSELVVASSGTPQAFALPGKPGRILVTSAMLAGLDARERHVLLAHERTHLRHRHDRLRLCADLSAAANPLLIPLRDTVAYLLERWADETAAENVANRTTAARAVARAALLSHRSRAACTPLRFSHLAVTRRVAALQDAPLPPARLWVCALLALAAAPALGAVDATGDFFRLLGDSLHL